jgi:hypothetical protein
MANYKSSLIGHAGEEVKGYKLQRLRSVRQNERFSEHNLARLAQTGQFQPSGDNP